MAASAVAPINSAPMAATLISVSMANGVPERIRRIALVATGANPTSVVAIKAMRLSSGLTRLSAQLTIISAVSSSNGPNSPRREGLGGSAWFAWVPSRVNPACCTASWMRRLRFDWPSTTSFSVANNTRAFTTPGMAVTAFSIFLAQLGQSIPVTFQL
ncbi:hypothetical protein D3C72_1271260 [compost metagenome]